MRKLILSFFILSLGTLGLYVTQKSQASVSTTIAPAGTPLRTLDGPLWKYPKSATSCSRSFTEPYAAYTFDVTTSGDYTFTMNTSGFDGAIYIYRTLFVPTNPCGNIVNGQWNQEYITDDSLAFSLSATNPGRYVVVFTAKNIVECPNCPNQNTHSSNVNGTFSASVVGPAPITKVQNVTTTLVDPNTALNSENNYSWKYPVKTDCSTLSGTVPFAAQRITVPSSGNYTFTMNTSGFAGAIHVYSSFNPDDPCTLNLNPTDGLDTIITGNSVTVPVTTFGSPVSMTVVFSAQSPGEGGTFSASVTGPSVVTVLPPGDLAIASQPISKSVSKGCQQTLSVYVTGPTPQTFQWYEGISGQLSTSLIINGANSNSYTTPALNGDKSYWVRVTNGTDHVDSHTIKFKVYDGTNTPFKGSLDTIQTWNLRTTNCNQLGPSVHYRAIHFRIPVSGQYRVHLNSHTFPGQYAITEYDFLSIFDATQPCVNFGGGVTNTDLTNHFVGGQDVIFVISATTPGALGDFDGYITSNDSCTLPETIEDALIISGNPLDQAVTPGNSATLTFAYNGGSNGNKNIQWYKGASGDTSQPIAGATTPTYTTPALSQANNETTYYYYWARVNDPDSFTHADTGSAVVSVITPPITYSDFLTACDEQYAQVSGPVTYYKIFPFKVSVTGAYTFSISANGFTPFVALYQGFFFSTYPNLNYYGPGGTQTLLASPNNYYLVITSTGAGQTGNFTLNINGPALVVPSLRPEIRTQPTDKVVFRDQTTTLSVTTNSPVVSYQWFTGTCANKTAVSGANLASYTTPPMTDYKDYWVKVSYGVMYVNSNIAHVRIKPQAVTDGYIIDEDTTLNVAAPGVLANDKKADSKTLIALKVSDPTLGGHILSTDGSLTYAQPSNVNGPDVFRYKVSDGTLESDSENIAILVRAINDPPVFTGGSFNNHTFNEDGAIGTLHLGGVNFGPGGGSDEASQQLTYKVTAVPPANMGDVVLADNTTVVTANTTYTLAQIRGMGFKPAANGFGGPAQFAVTVTDNGESYTGPDPKSITLSLNITVNAVADTPSVTSATTNEDMKTISGLVISRNSADAAEVTHFRIGAIKNGTLYKNDGVTQITDAQFITYAEGQAGLKFSPNANLFSPNHIFSFDVQSSLSNSPSGLGGDSFKATITVDPVAELPSVTSASTFVNLQTTSGLVITRNSPDGSEIGYFKLSSITNGTLYKSDGATQIGEGQYITVAEGSAGLKFTPAQDSPAQGSFVVQGSANTSGSGLGAAATANITVSKYNTSTTVTSVNPAPSYLGQQVTVSYDVLNTTGGPTPAGDVVVTVSGGTETCTGTVAAGSCTVTLTHGGNPRTITAAYVGNSQFNNSAGTKDHVVNACTLNTVVTSTADDGTAGTLRDIVDNACEGSTITFDPTVFDPANGPYVISLGSVSTFSKELSIDKNLSIRGPGANVLTVQRSTGSHVPRFRIFNIATDANVTISGLTIRNGFATGTAFNDNLVGKGGGILNGGNLTLKTCSVSGNKAGVQPETSGLGAGVYSSGPLTVLNSTISGNDAVTGGGAIYVQAGTTASLINVTVSGNTTPGNGGGIDLSPTAHLTLINSTITNNSATTSGGGIYVDAGILIMGNSIVADNNSATGPDVLLLPGLIETVGHNLIGKNDGAESAFPSGSPNTHSDLVGTSPTPLLALIGALANNGGATQTHLPFPGSPAVDSGTNTYVPEDDEFDVDGDGNSSEPFPGDQRGQSRITNNTVDIGAVEVSYSITTTAGAGQSAVINTAFTTPMQAVVTESGKPKKGVSVTFAAPASGAAGTFNGSVSANVTTDENGIALAPVFTANGLIGSYDVVASLEAITPSATFSLSNTQGQAQVILGNLTQTFDGTPKSASAVTIPPGLPVVFTYDGSNTPPVNAGAYQVAAMISDPNHSGMTSGTLSIVRADQAISFGALPNRNAGDSPFALNASATSGLPVSFNVLSGPASIIGDTLTLTGSGKVVVRASQSGDGNHNPALSVNQSFDINKTPATITISNLSQTYDGTAKAATVMTDPPNLNILVVSYSQNGVAVAAPTNVGSYDVAASLSNDNYQASDVTGKLIIARAEQSISFDSLANRVYGEPDFTMSATASSDLSISFSAAGNCTVSGNSLHLTGSGTCTVTASQAGNANYNAAGPVSQSFNINKAAASITLGNLSQGFDGTARSVTATTSPSGLSVSLTYNGSTVAPTNAGSYAVVGTINDSNYQGSATDQMVIALATPVITWSPPSDITYGAALSATQLNATASVAGSFSYAPQAGTVLNAGQQTLAVDFTPADLANYNVASRTVSLNVSKAAQTITFASLPNKTYGDGDFGINATTSSNLPVSFTASGSCTVTGATVQLFGAGQCKVSAAQSGDTNYNPAASVEQSFTVLKANQTITLGALADRVYGEPDFPLSATASSELSVSLSASGNCTISGNILHLTGAGTCTVTASQPGNADINAATPVARTFSIGKADQQITFDPLANKTVGDADFSISATASSNLAVSFAAAGNCTVNGSQVRLTGVGPCTLTASQDGDANINAATPVARTFSIGKADQQITFEALADKKFGDADFNVSGKASSNLAVSFAASGSCTVNGSQVRLTGAGSCTITASQDGDANVNAATPVARTFSIGKADQQITFEALADKKFGDADFNVSGKASSNLAVSFAASGSCTVNGSQVHLIGAGPCTITASQDGDANVNAAVPVARTFSIGKADQQITFEALADKKFGDADFNVSGKASSNLAVSFAASGNCTMNGSQVRLTGAGSCTITASQDGDENVNAATPVARTFSISKADQQITFEALADKKFGEPDFTVSATASSELSVGLSATGNCTIAGNTLHLTGAGTCTVTASQAGNADYNLATSIEQSFTVLKANQTITFGALADRVYGEPDFTVNATASSELSLSFSATGNCTISGNTVHLTGAGTCTVTASQAGDGNYTAAASLDQTFTIAQATTTLALTSSANPANAGQAVTFMAAVTSSAGTPTGTIQFTDNGNHLGSPVALDESGLASLDISTLTVGTHTISANYLADANFTPSTGTLSGGQVINDKPDDNRPVISFSLSNYNVNEADGFVRVIINRGGDTTSALSVDYATDDTGAAADCGALNSGLASARCDFTTMLGTLTFAANQTQKTLDIPFNQDSYLEGPEVFTLNLSNPTGGANFASSSSATVTINDSASPAPNAIDDTATFVRQQYHDFLNREADAPGLAFWTNNIDKCNDPGQRQAGQTLAQCIATQRILTSAAFFLSIEFRQTGGLVRDFHVAALDRPATNNVPDFIEFERDTQRIQNGVIVGEGAWQQVLNENRAEFMSDFVMRAEFVGLYPTTDTPTQYVDKIYQHAGITPETPQERADAIAEFGAVATAADAGARGRALMRITQNAEFQARELNRSFVHMEYIGYLRRNPNEAPDGNFAGYDFWLRKLIQSHGDFVQAEMIKSFLTSDEYRKRFGR